MGYADSNAVPLTDRSVGESVCSGAVARPRCQQSSPASSASATSSWMRSTTRRTGLVVPGLRSGRSRPSGWTPRPTVGSLMATTATSPANVLARADTAIVIQLPFPLMFWRAFRRTALRSLRREQLWNENRESWRTSFASRDSVLLEVWAEAAPLSQIPPANRVRTAGTSFLLSDHECEAVERVLPSPGSRSPLAPPPLV